MRKIGVLLDLKDSSHIVMIENAIYTTIIMNEINEKNFIFELYFSNKFTSNIRSSYKEAIVDFRNQNVFAAMGLLKYLFRIYKYFFNCPSQKN